MEVLWLIVVALGPVLLGAALAYALIRRRKEGPGVRQARKRATERLYREEEPQDGADRRGH